VRLTKSKSDNINPTANRFIKETLHKAYSFEALLTRIQARTPQHGTKSLLDTAKAVSQNISASINIELKANKNLSVEQIINLCTNRSLLLDSIHEVVFKVIQATEYTLYPMGLIAATEILIQDIIPTFALILNPYEGGTYKITAYPKLLDSYRKSLGPYQKKETKKEKRLPEWIVVLSYPAVQSNNILLHTIMVGHEVMHLEDWVSNISSTLIKSGQVKIIKKEVRREAKKTKEKQGGELFKNTGPVLRSWLREIIADLIAIRRFGPAYFFSFLSLSFALGVMDQFSERHPSSRTRLKLMFDELRNMGYMRPRKINQRIVEELQFWENYINSKNVYPSGKYLIALNSILRARERIRARVRALNRSKEYTIHNFLNEVPKLLEYLNNGIPPSEVFDISTHLSTPATLSGILNAGMCQYLDGLKEIQGLLKNEGNLEMLAMTKFNELLSRAIEVSIVLQEWKKGTS
jgi:hypothetical protein